MAASQPACWPTHSCWTRAPLKMSSLMTDSTALPIILLGDFTHSNGSDSRPLVKCYESAAGEASEGFGINQGAWCIGDGQLLQLPHTDIEKHRSIVE